MKKVFILYALGDGKTHYIDTNLKAICLKVRKRVKSDPDFLGMLPELWVNQYELEQDAISAEFKNVLDAFDRGEETYDLSFF